MKVTVIGIGKVGSTIAFILAREGLTDELVLWNRTESVAQADAIDIQQACAFTPHHVSVRAGDVQASAGSDILIMCASVPTDRELTDRSELSAGNAALVRELIPRFASMSPSAVIVNVTNPVDAITWQILRVSGFPWQRVIGTGTLVDSARFRDLLSKQVGIHPVDLKAYILGEHGDSQFAALSVATAGGEHIDATPALYRMLEDAKESAFEVLRAKGFTNYTVSMAVEMIVESIVRDLRYTLPVSVRVDGFCGVCDVCLSLPAVIGRGGVRLVLRPDLDEKEQAAFRRCAEAIRGTLQIMG
jgi:L-lactate dehydrogenase